MAYLQDIFLFSCTVMDYLCIHTNNEACDCFDSCSGNIMFCVLPKCMFTIKKKQPLSLNRCFFNINLKIQIQKKASMSGLCHISHPLCVDDALVFSGHAARPFPRLLVQTVLLCRSALLLQLHHLQTHTHTQIHHIKKSSTKNSINTKISGAPISAAQTSEFTDIFLSVQSGNKRPQKQHFNYTVLTDDIS